VERRGQQERGWGEASGIGVGLFSLILQVDLPDQMAGPAAPSGAGIRPGPAPPVDSRPGVRATAGRAFAGPLAAYLEPGG
jgi:hypothetical protein